MFSFQVGVHGNNCFICPRDDSGLSKKYNFVSFIGQNTKILFYEEISRFATLLSWCIRFTKSILKSCLLSKNDLAYQSRLIVQLPNRTLAKNVSLSRI